MLFINVVYKYFENRPFKERILRSARVLVHFWGRYLQKNHKINKRQTEQSHFVIRFECFGLCLELQTIYFSKLSKFLKTKKFRVIYFGLKFSKLKKTKVFRISKFSKISKILIFHWKSIAKK